MPKTALSSSPHEQENKQKLSTMASQQDSPSAERISSRPSLNSGTRKVPTVDPGPKKSRGRKSGASKLPTERAASKATLARNSSNGNTNTSGILKLPMELIERIASFLQHHDELFVHYPFYSWQHQPKLGGRYDWFGNFRLANRQIHDMTFDTFRRRYFTRRMVKIQQKSLENLVSISEHPSLSKQIQELIITAQCHNKQDNDLVNEVRAILDHEEASSEIDEEAFSEIDPRALRHANRCFQKFRPRFLASIQRDAHLRTSGHATRLLSRALKGLRGVQSIVYGIYGEFHPTTNLGERATDLWADFVNEARDHLPKSQVVFPHFSSYSLKWLSESGHRDVDIVIAALVERATTQSFPTLRFEDGSLMLQGRGPPSSPSRISLKKCFSKLQQLHLSFAATDKARVDEAHRFIEAAPQELEELEIDFKWEGEDEVAGPLYEELLLNLSLPHLRRLSIQNVKGKMTLTAIPEALRNHRQTLMSVEVEHYGGADDEFNDFEAKWSRVAEACMQVDKLVELKIANLSMMYGFDWEWPTPDKIGNPAGDPNFLAYVFLGNDYKKVPAWNIESSAKGLKEDLRLLWLEDWKEHEEREERLFREFIEGSPSAQSTSGSEEDSDASSTSSMSGPEDDADN